MESTKAINLDNLKILQSIASSRQNGSNKIAYALPDNNVLILITSERKQLSYRVIIDIDTYRLLENVLSYLHVVNREGLPLRIILKRPRRTNINRFILSELKPNLVKNGKPYQIEYINGNILDNRLINLKMIIGKPKNSKVYLNTEELKGIKIVDRIQKTSTNGFDRRFYLLDNETMLVEFSNDLVTVQSKMDLEDYYKFRSMLFFPEFRPGLTYENSWRIKFNTNNKKGLLHRLVMNCLDSTLEIDHIDRDPLNNCKKKLETS